MNNYLVYIHTNNINNKKYVGLTKQKPQERWRHDGLGYKNQPKFFRAIVKYGWNNFTHTIVKTNLTAHDAGLLEQKLIKQYDTIANGYNISPGGEITNHSPETLEKMRQSMLGKTHSESTKRKISQSKDNDKIAVICVNTNIVYESGAAAAKQTGIDASSISKCCRGLVQTAGGYNWEYNDITLKKEYQNIKQHNINKCKKQVQCIDTGIIYESVQAAAKATQSDASNITKVCKGKYKSTNGLKWRFYIEEEDYE